MPKNPMSLPRGEFRLRRALFLVFALPGSVTGLLADPHGLLLAAAISSPPPGAAFLGPFHMVVLHFPIGLFSFAALLELITWFRPFEGLRRVLDRKSTRLNSSH